MDSSVDLHSAQFSDYQFSERLTNVWDFAQRGLVYPSPYAIFALGFLADNTTVSREELAQLMVKVRCAIHTTESLKQCNTTLVLGVESSLWKAICCESEMKVPAGLSLNFPGSDDPDHSTVFDRSSNSFEDSNGDLWFHIKSDNAAACEAILALIQLTLGDKLASIEYEKAESKSIEEDGHGGKVLGCRFSENLNNPADPVTIGKHTIVGAEDIEHVGASNSKF